MTKIWKNRSSSFLLRGAGPGPPAGGGSGEAAQGQKTGTYQMQEQCVFLEMFLKTCFAQFRPFFWKEPGPGTIAIMNEWICGLAVVVEICTLNSPGYLFSVLSLSFFLRTLFGHPGLFLERTRPWDHCHQIRHPPGIFSAGLSLKTAL